jgi:hypothetical protein
MAGEWELFISSSPITSGRLYWDTYDAGSTADGVYVLEKGPDHTVYQVKKNGTVVSITGTDGFGISVPPAQSTAISVIGTKIVVAGRGKTSLADSKVSQTDVESPGSWTTVTTEPNLGGHFWDKLVTFSGTEYGVHTKYPFGAVQQGIVSVDKDTGAYAEINTKAGLADPVHEGGICKVTDDWIAAMTRKPHPKTGASPIWVTTLEGRVEDDFFANIPNTFVCTSIYRSWSWAAAEGGSVSSFPGLAYFAYENDVLPRHVVDAVDSEGNVTDAYNSPDPIRPGCVFNDSICTRAFVIKTDGTILKSSASGLSFSEYTKHPKSLAPSETFTGLSTNEDGTAMYAFTASGDIYRYIRPNKVLIQGASLSGVRVI